MNRFESITKPLMWFMALLLAAVMAGCGGSSETTAVLPNLVSVTVTPATASIPTNGIKQFVATAVYKDGSSTDVTADPATVWTSASTGVATVVSTTGVATGVASGTSVIAASFGGLSGSATLTVTTATLTSIAVTPATATVPIGGVKAFVATATYSDATTSDVTAFSTWASATTGVATIVSTTGVATGVANGASVITASFGGKTNTANLSVSTATLVSIAVTPATATINMGVTQAFRAFATYSYGPVVEVTASATWASATTGVATIVPTTGVATGVASGTSDITATIGSVHSSPVAVLHVNAAILQSITVTPANPSIAKGLTKQFVATAHYDIGPDVDMTTSASINWTSADVTVASVGSHTGLAATGISTITGTSTITATIGTIYGSTVLTVTTATLSSITVTSTPADPSIAKGLTQPFVATATYSDGTTTVVTEDLTTVWTSVNVPATGTAVATLSTSGIAGAGVATGNAVGTSTITATFSGQSGSATLQVTQATLTSIAVTSTPANPSIAVGGTQQFVATATMSDGPLVVTTSASWVSSAPAVATLSLDGTGGGIATGQSVGTSTITATYVAGGITQSATAVLTVTSGSVLPGAGATPTVLSSSPTEGDFYVPTSTNSKLVGGANNTETGKLVTATFSEAMNSATIIPVGVFTLYDNTAASGVSGVVTMNIDNTLEHAANMVAIFTPDAALAPNHHYTATITSITPRTAAATPAPISSDVAWSFDTGVALIGQAPVDLLSISSNNFVILANTAITDANPSAATASITGNVALATITGSPNVTVTCGGSMEPGWSIYIKDATITDTCVVQNSTLVAPAELDRGTAYTDATGRSNPAAASLAADISGMTLTPGIYAATGGVLIYAVNTNADPLGVTLNCQGDSNAVFIFQIPGTLTLGQAATPAQISLIGNCQAKNVFWAVASTGVTITPSSVFSGNILATTTVAMQLGAVLHGRTLAGADVTLIGNTIAP